MTIRRYTASSTAGYSWIEVDHGRRGAEEDPLVEHIVFRIIQPI